MRVGVGVREVGGSIIIRSSAIGRGGRRRLVRVRREKLLAVRRKVDTSDWRAELEFTGRRSVRMLIEGVNIPQLQNTLHVARRK